MNLRHRCAICCVRIAGLPKVRPLVIGFVMLLNAVHPLIHGSPLDGGMLDAVMGQLDLAAATLAQG